jgi:hypothetical protein
LPSDRVGRIPKLQQQTGSRFGIEVMHRGENSGMERTGRLDWIPFRMPVEKENATSRGIFQGKWSVAAKRFYLGATDR